MDSRDSTPRVSFIAIVDFTQEAKWLFLTDSCSDLLGYEPSELVGRSSLELVHPDEFSATKQIHYDTIQQDKAAVLAYLRMKHKDPYKGYVLCAISRTVVHDVLAGSVSYASAGAKAFHNNSTAQEVTVITQYAKDFQLRRWADPSPMPKSPIPATMMPSVTDLLNPIHGSPRPRTPQFEDAITFERLPNQSIRTLLILDRFSVECPIIYCSNDLMVRTTDVLGRSFYDLVKERDEDHVQQWINVVKAWGVNERGQPSDGGFGFGKFDLCTRPRDSRERMDAHSSDSSSKHRSSLSRARAKAYNGAAASSRRPHLVAGSMSPEVGSPTVPVDVVFSAHSDGVMVILRQAQEGMQ